MECLIDTPKDIHLLMKCGVISSQSISIREEHIARMWDNICQSSHGPKESLVNKLKEELKEVLREKYYQTKIPIIVHDTKSFIMKSYSKFQQEYFSKPS